MRLKFSALAPPISVSSSGAAIPCNRTSTFPNKRPSPSATVAITVDSTAMEKNIAHPTDARLYETARRKLVGLAREAGIGLRQYYKRLAPRLAAQVGRSAHVGIPDLHPQRVENDDGIHPVERPALPFPDLVEIGVRVVEEVSGAVVEVMLDTDIPAATQLLSPRNYMNNGATAAAVAYDCSGVYVETDY